MHKIVENRVLYYEIKISEQRINDALIVLTISEWYFSIAIVNGSSLHELQFAHATCHRNDLEISPPKFWHMRTS
jgi:hypothetical protein